MATPRFWLYRLPLPPGDGGLETLLGLRQPAPGWRVYRTIAGDEVYAYLGPNAPDLPSGRLPGAAAVTRLDCTLALDGAAAGTPAPWHYVVETDVQPGHEREFNAWYDEEHLPALAAVPGTVSVMRLRDPEGSPRYHACYELATRETLGSPAWLAVRESAWSSRVRPWFRNTRRIMFQQLLPPA